MDSIGEKILKLRKKYGLSQEELGFEVGVSRQTVSKWELGKVVPDTKNLLALCEFFKIDIGYLIPNKNNEGNNVNSFDEPIKEVDKTPKKLFKIKILLVISIFIAIILIGLLIIVTYISIPNNDNVENIIVTSNVVTIKDIQLLCIIALTIIACLSIVLIIILIRIKNKNKKIRR